MQEENYEQQEDYRFDTIYNSILKFIKTLVVYSFLVFFFAMASFWFMYEVEGKSLSTHTSELSIKLVKQLAEDGYLAGAKVLFTEDEYCHQRGSRPTSCISKDDQRKLDNLIERALFNGGPDGITK